MQYDSYHEKIKRRADFLARLYSHIVIISVITCTVVFSVCTLLIMKGAVLSDGGCPEEVIYGDAYSFTPKAFLSDVTVEYSPADTDEWTTLAPTEAGSYKIRAVTENSLGNTRYCMKRTLTILPRPTTASISDASVVYGEQPRVSADNLLDGATVEGRVEFADLTMAQTDAWIEQGSIKIKDAGRDVTHNYAVTYAPAASLKVLSKDISVLIKDASKVYDNKLLSSERYSLSDCTLADGDYMVAVSESSMTDAGEMQGLIGFRILNGAGKDVTQRYNINYTAGTLTIETRPIVVGTGTTEEIYSATPLSYQIFTVLRESDREFLSAQGHTVGVRRGQSITDCGSIENLLELCVTDADGNDKTLNYNIVIDAAALGKITIKPRPIKVVTESAALTYDGEKHLFDRFTVEGNIPSHYFVAVPESAFINAGTYKNIQTARATDGQKDVTANYDIEYVYGDITIAKLPITITTQSAQKEFDGEYSSYIDFECKQILPLSDKFEAIEAKAFCYRGEYYNDHRVRVTNASGEDVTANYELDYVLGTVTITPRTVSVRPKNTSSTYTGKPISAMQALEETESTPFLNSLEKLGYTVYISCKGEGTNITKDSPIPITLEYLRLFDKNGRDVTSSLNVESENGFLTIEKHYVTFKTDYTKDVIYTGSDIANSDYKVYPDGKGDYGLLEGHTATAVLMGVGRNVGVYDNCFDRDTTRIYDENGTDVTENYGIWYIDGQIRILPRPITVTTESAGVMYDGKTHIFAGFTVTPHSDYPLIAGHSFEGYNYSEYKSYTKAPQTNSHDVRIKDEQGNVVYDSASYTDNYDVTFNYGKVSVYQRPIRLKTLDETWVYDGKDNRRLEIFYADYNEYPPIEGHTPRVNTKNKENIVNAGTFENYLFGRIYDENGADVTDNYVIEYTRGTVSIKKRPIDLYTQSATVVYSGSVFRLDGYTVEGLLDGHGSNFRAIDGFEIINAGVYENRHVLEIFDSGDADKTDNYEIIAHYGTVTVLRRSIEIRPLDESQPWNRQPLKPQILQKDSIMNSFDRLGFTFNAVSMSGERTDVGISYSYVTEVIIKDKNGNNVNDNFNISYTAGTLEVTPLIIDICPDAQSKPYDGTPLKAVNALDLSTTHNFQFLLNEGYTYEVVVEGEQTEIGRSSSYIVSFIMYDADKNDVTGNFDIVTRAGSLTVTAEAIKILLYHNSKVYDGAPITLESAMDDYEVISAGIGMNVSVDFSFSLTEYGSYRLGDIRDQITVTVTDASGKIIPRDEITVIYVNSLGEESVSTDVVLEVKKRDVTFTAATVEKEYNKENPEPLSDSTVTISMGELVNGHTFTAFVDGLCTQIGTVDNVIMDIRIYDEKGKDVTDNYNPSYINGKLTLYAPEEG